MKTQPAFPHQRAYFILAILAVTVLLFSLKDEPGLTYDSYDYIEASQSMAAYFYGKNVDGFSFTLRSPLYPLYLSLFEDKITAAWWLNVACFLSSLWILVLIAEHLKWNAVWIYAIFLLTAISLPWLQNHFLVWTEPLFSAILLLLVYIILKRRSVAFILITCLILFSVRKAGLFIIIITCFYYLLQRQYRNFLWLGIISSVFVIAWEIIVSSFADRSPFMANFEYLIQLDRSAFVDVITAWILPRKIPVAIRAILIIIGLISFVMIFRSRLGEFLKEDHNKLFVTYLLGYCLFFIIVVGSAGYHETERYVSVVIPIFILIITSFASQMHKVSKRKVQLFHVLLLLWSLYPLLRTINYFAEH